MAEAATGLLFEDIFEIFVKRPLKLPAVVPPLFSSRIIRTGVMIYIDQFETLFQAFFNKTLWPNTYQHLENDATRNKKWVYPPPSILIGESWHASMGAWIECKSATWQPDCGAHAGTYVQMNQAGFVMWIDRKENYYGLLLQNKQGGHMKSALDLVSKLRPLVVNFFAATDAPLFAPISARVTHKQQSGGCIVAPSILLVIILLLQINLYF
mmetsp:Transcript_1479/g.1666  ORF Transcript_1479/g.1666 Transcript_1479/m.1666 type:complete len:211 (+) Transcript_1479:242-874(+)